MQPLADRLLFHPFQCLLPASLVRGKTFSLVFIYTLIIPFCPIHDAPPHMCITNLRKHVAVNIRNQAFHYKHIESYLHPSRCSAEKKKSLDLTTLTVTWILNYSGFPFNIYIFYRHVKLHLMLTLM